MLKKRRRDWRWRVLARNNLGDRCFDYRDVFHDLNTFQSSTGCADDQQRHLPYPTMTTWPSFSNIRLIHPPPCFPSSWALNLDPKMTTLGMRMLRLVGVQ